MAGKIQIKPVETFLMKGGLCKSFFEYSFPGIINNVFSYITDRGVLFVVDHQNSGNAGIYRRKISKKIQKKKQLSHSKI